MLMNKVPCRCGKSSMLFKNKIGPFYVGKCCEIAGFDHFGNLKSEVAKVKEEVKQVLPSKAKTSGRKAPEVRVTTDVRPEDNFDLQDKEEKSEEES